MDRSEATTQLAREKTGMEQDWAPYIWERVKGGIVITGCKTRPKKSGPNKGEPMFLTREDNHRVVVTAEEVDRVIQQRCGPA